MKTTFGLQQGATIYFSATPLHSIYLANVNINENGEESISVVTLQIIYAICKTIHKTF